MSEKCRYILKNGRQCAQWAVHSSDPPRCRSHGGRALLPVPPLVQCGAACADGTPCQRYAVRGSDPPRCVSHGGCKNGGKIGAPTGPRNGMWKYGAHEGQTKKFTTIDDLMEKQAWFSALLDRVVDVREAAMLVSLHSQNAVRLAKLMRDKKALEKDAQDPFDEAMSQALDELAEELGLGLGQRRETAS